MRRLLIGLVLVLGGCGDTPTPPGKLYDVGGFKQHLYCSGPENTGQPTVIIENGGGVVAVTEYWLQTELQKTVRVCSYDRSGMGWSDEFGAPHDATTFARQLHTLLTVAQVKPPYVLAGHSLGGLIIPLYAKFYPGEVAGLVFLDPSHPDQGGVIPDFHDKLAQATRTIKRLGYVAALGGFDIYQPHNDAENAPGMVPKSVIDMTRYFNRHSKGYFAMAAETGLLDESFRQAKEVTDLGDLPLVVISAKSGMPDGQWALHEKIAHISTRGRHVTFEDASHMSLIVGQPYATRAVGEILNVVREARSN